MDKILPENEVNEIFKQSEQLRIKNQEEKEKSEKERQNLIAKGKELFKKYIPSNAQSLIVAILEQDDCDLMTDYFSTIYKDHVILGYSMHKKDLFSEMRKFADKIPETAHLKELNPEYEHREKYSMGAGYYLKSTNRYSTGWKIQKEYWTSNYPLSDEWYISLAKRCIFSQEQPKSEKPVNVSNNQEKPIISQYKGHPILTLPYNDKGFSFGLSKAKAILKYIEDIKAFVENA